MGNGDDWGARPTDPRAPELRRDGPAIGSVLVDRYELRAKLGGGGRGAVYRAFDRRVGEELALKILLPGDAGALERFRREVGTARKIGHPNVCRVFDAGEAESVCFLTMELIEGESLRALAARGPVARARALAILTDVLRGLEAIHRDGLIHRDLKPENIVVRAGDQRAIIVDFGLAKIPAESTAIAGTPAHVSPEQLRGDALDQRSDLYAWGIIASELLGKDDPLAPIVDRALKRNADERWASAAELLEALEHRRSPRKSAVWLTGGLLIILAAVWGLFYRPAPRRARVEVAEFADLTADRRHEDLARSARESIRSAIQVLPGFEVSYARPEWKLVGSVQRRGDRLQLVAQVQPGEEATGSPSIEVEAGEDDPSRAIDTLRKHLTAELRLLQNMRNRRVRMLAEPAREKLSAYFDLVGSVPSSVHFEPGQRLLDEALAIEPRSIFALTERAKLSLYRAGEEGGNERLQSGLAHLETASRLAPRDPEVIVLLCRARQFALEAGGDPTDDALEAAFAVCRRALQADPFSAQVQLAIARLEDLRCRDERAIEALERALELDVSLSGPILEHLLALAMQNGKTIVAERASLALVEFQERERALGAEALSRRAGVPPAHGAHVLRAGVLLRAGRLPEAKRELEEELSAGAGDRWAEAAAIRGLLRIEPNEALAGRLSALEARLKASAKDQPAILATVARAYQWTDLEEAVKWLELGSASSCVEAIGRAFMFKSAQQRDKARAAIAECTKNHAWIRECKAKLDSEL